MMLDIGNLRLGDGLTAHEHVEALENHGKRFYFSNNQIPNQTLKQIDIVDSRRQNES